MARDVLDAVKVIELDEDDPSLPTLGSHYVTTSYYDLSVVRELEAWRMEAPLKLFESPLKKRFFHVSPVAPARCSLWSFV